MRKPRPLLGLEILIILYTAPLLAQTENEVTDAHCEGIREYTLADRSRIDCLLEEEAQEYDWGHKWQEGIGQSLHYAMHTGRRAGLVLLIRENRDVLGAKRAARCIAHYNLPITLHVLDIRSTN